jgi:CHAT domain-containing protein
MLVVTLFALASRVHADCDSAEAAKVREALRGAELAAGGTEIPASKFAEARRLLDQAHCDALSLFHAMLLVAQVFEGRGELETAAGHLESACRLAEGIADEQARRQLQVQCKGLLLSSWLELDRHADAVRLAHEVRTLADASGLDTVDLIQTLLDAESRALVRADWKRAGACREAAEALARGEYGLAIRVSSRLSEAEAHCHLGEYGRALDRVREARRLLGVQPSAKRVASALQVLSTCGRIYVEVRKPRLALEAYEEGFRLAPGVLEEAKQDPAQRLVASLSVGKLCAGLVEAQLLLGRADEARATVGTAQGWLTAAGDADVGKFYGLADLAKALDKLPMDDLTVRNVWRVLAEARDKESILGIQVEFPPALPPDVVREMLRSSPEERRPRVERIEMHRFIAWASRMRGQWHDSLVEFAQTIALVEEARLQAPYEALTTFFTPFTEIYGQAVEAIHAARDHGHGEPLDPSLAPFGASYGEAALHLSELSKARAFHERYGRALARAWSERLPPALRSEEERLRRRVGETGPSVSMYGLADLPGTRARHQREAQSAQADYLRFLDSIKAKHEEYVSAVDPRPARLSDLPKQLDGRYLVVYQVAAEGTYWWVIHDRKLLAFDRFGLSREELRKEVDWVARFVDDPLATTSRLRPLLWPFAEVRKAASTSGDALPRVVIVPDDSLHFLPWEALPGSRGRPLGEEFVVSYAPSLTVLAKVVGAERAPERKSAFVVGDVRTDRLEVPDLPEGFEPLGRCEFDAVVDALRAAGYRLKLAEADRADPETILGLDLIPYDVVHLDAHAFAGTLDPLPSLVLHPSKRRQLGLFSMEDASQLRLKARLVTLSACDTALGKDADLPPGIAPRESLARMFVPGEGVEGLARGFLLAGARSVLASLWRARTGATRQLMARFYAGLATGASPVLALHRAKEDLRRAKAPASDWSVFVLIGDGD